MTPHNRATLDRHRHHHFTLVNAQYMKGLNVHEREDMLRVAREEFFGAGYSPDMFCPKCVADFVLVLYRAYDEWLVNNKD